MNKMKIEKFDLVKIIKQPKCSMCEKSCVGSFAIVGDTTGVLTACFTDKSPYEMDEYSHEKKSKLEWKTADDIISYYKRGGCSTPIRDIDCIELIVKDVRKE